MAELKTDRQLLREYGEHGSEGAFQAIVERHLDLVFATARRGTNDNGAAQEIAQNVFIALARKAPWLQAEISVAGWIAYRRFPQQPAVPLGEDRRDILRFVAQSSVATGVLSLTAPLSLLVLGRVASTRQVAFFRAAMSPQQAFAVVSAPARLILLTEQTRDWERGTRDVVFAGIRRYTLGMAAAAAVILPPLLVFTPEVSRLLFSAKNERPPR